MSWDLFISHASEDKDIARSLSDRLSASGYRVWLDASELTLGDSLRTKIDQGLAQSRYGVVILSPAFFAKHWPALELNGLAAREEGGKKVLLPVWHGVKREDVAAYSPMLADRLAVSSDAGVGAVADAIARALAASSENGEVAEAIRNTARDAARTRAEKRRSNMPTSVLGVGVGVLIASIAAGLFWTTRDSSVPPPTSSTSTSVPPDPPPPAPELIGRVIDQQSRKPVEGAKVSIDGTGIPRLRYTDSEGVFRIEAPSSAGRLRVEHDGFAPYERLLNAGASGPAEDIRLKPLASPQAAPVQKRTFSANGMFSTLEFRGTIERTEADAFYEYRPRVDVIFHQTPEVMTQKIQFARIVATIPAGPGQPAIVLGADIQPVTLEFSSDSERKSLPNVVLRLEKAKADAASFVGLALVYGTGMWPIPSSLK